MGLKLPAAVTSKFGRQLLHLQKASPKLMFAGGIVGVVGAGVLACRATLKLSDVFDEAEKKSSLATHEREINPDEYAEKTYLKDLGVIKVRTALEIVKLYTPAVGLGIVSVGLLTGSHVVLNRRNASLTAAYAAVDKAFGQYRERVREELGPDKDRNFRYGVEVVEETVEGKDGKIKTIKHERAPKSEAYSEYARLFTEGMDMWRPNPELNRLFLQSQQNYFNSLLRAQGHVMLNEVYDALGMERSSAGAVVGWVLGAGGDDYIDFGIFDDATNPKVRDFVNLAEGSILLDFNVDGVVYDKIGRH
jgi:hypothetical protein